MDRYQFITMCEYLGFPSEATGSLSLAYMKILSDSKTKSFCEESVQMYRTGSFPEGMCQRQFDFEELSSSLGVHCFQSQMIFYILLIPVLREKYIQKNIDLSILDNSMSDFRCKLYECYNVYGIWGSFVAVWFSRFFNFTLYGIGRLEFVPFRAEYDYEDEYGFVKKGDQVIDVHIPSKGKLSHDEVIRSYFDCIDFFENHLDFHPKAFVCESWLLFEGHREIIPECRNIIAFMDDYHITERGDDTEGDLWRIFNTNDFDDPETLPCDTYLRRQYVDFIKKGGVQGYGKGIFMIGELRKKWKRD